jgi:transcriptional regulator with XRE-family HTH domain
VYGADVAGDDAPMPRGRRANVRVLFGRRLRLLRKLRMLTQEELGERAGVTGKLVGQIERGDGNPTLEVMAGLAAALEIELPSLLVLDEQRPPGSASATRAFAAAEKVSQYFVDRPASEIDRALRILEAAIGEPKP